MSEIRSPWHGDRLHPDEVSEPLHSKRPHFRVRRTLQRDEAGLLHSTLFDEAVWETLPKLSVTRRSSVARMLLPSGPIAIKRYEEPGVYALRTIGRLSRAHREARALDLIAAALPEAPVRALAWCETRRFGFVTRSYLVTNELENCIDLRAIKGLTGDARTRAAGLVLHELPGMVAALHDAGIWLRSLRGKNVLLHPTRPTLALIDQPLATAPRRFGLRHRLWDLASLSVELRRFLSAEQWRAFLDSYLGQSLDLEPSAKEGLDPERIEATARRLRHETPLTSIGHAAKRRITHNRLAAWLAGRSADSSDVR